MRSASAASRRASEAGIGSVIPSIVALPSPESRSASEIRTRIVVSTPAVFPFAVLSESRRIDTNASSFDSQGVGSVRSRVALGPGTASSGAPGRRGLVRARIAAR